MFQAIAVTKKLAALSVLSALVLLPFLRGQQIPSPSTPANTLAVSNADAPDACPHPFTAGKISSNRFIQYCVTDNGNVSSIETPFNVFHVDYGGEGYGLCQESPATEYHDWLVDASPNWNAAQVLSVSASAITISRATSDGTWTLVQTISKVASTGSIKIVMALTNNQSVDKVAYLVRFMDSIFGFAGASRDSAFAVRYERYPSVPYGIQLSNVGKWTGYRQGFVQNSDSFPNACAFASNTGLNLVPSAPHSLVYAYVGVVPAHGTKTVTMTYRGT